MKIQLFSFKEYEGRFFEAAFDNQWEVQYLDIPLNKDTADLTPGTQVVCLFVNDTANAEVIEKLGANGVKLIALRCAGYNNVDLEAAEKHGIQVVRVPAYSPYAVAEHTLALILALNRKIHKAYNRVREGNFDLNGLMGFDLHDKTVGVIGLGNIGTVTARILKGLGCKVLGYDVQENEECKALGVEMTDLNTLYARSDIISLHCPLNPHTHHLINQDSIKQMKKGVMLINTSRGALIDAAAVIEALKAEQIGHLGMDVYEEEGDLFFRDLSNNVIKDDTFMRLLTFPNVLVTGHQAFFTEEALENIAGTTAQNIKDFTDGKALENEVKPAYVHA